MTLRPAAALAIALLAAAPVAHAQAGAPAAAATATRSPITVSTDHSGRFNGQQLDYTATVAEHFLTDDKGQPAASVITIAYVRRGVADPTKRPVIFAFNGGPGASSSPLHMGALGPVRRVGEHGSHLADNPYSLLDAADLVFIDPVGTGFSRPFPGVDGRRWYNGEGDAKAVKSVIAEWLRQNHREGSPRYLAGESYGTVRAALIVKDSQDLPFDGVALIALVGSTPGHEMPYVASLPTMAAGAWFHGRIERGERSVEDVYREAAQFARTDYVSALIQGSSLPPAERHRVAERMSALIGLPADLIEQNDLRISKPVWMFNLLKDKGLRTGLLDVRVTAPLEPGQIGDIDDPALGVAPKRTPGAAPAPPPSAASIGPVPSPVVGDYIVHELKFPTTETYYGVNFTVNAAWTHEPAGADPMAAIGQAMKADHRLRVFWAAGYYDLTTPAYAARYTLDQDGIAPKRLTATYFAGPHGAYEGEENLAVFSAALRRFVAPQDRTP
jgi:carboxypeptidase C (cathepsin A)